MKMIYRKKLFLLILISAFLVSFLNIVSSYAQTEVEIQYDREKTNRILGISIFVILLMGIFWHDLIKDIIDVIKL